MKILIWVLAGFMGGVIVSRNAEPMNTPQTAAVFLALFVGCGIMWTAGYRGKSEAVATAVSVAVSIAEAKAEAHSKSVATSAINLFLGTQAGLSPEMVGTIADQAIEETHHESQLTSQDGVWDGRTSRSLQGNAEV